MRSIDVFPSVRIQRGAAATISHQFTDTDGEPAAPPAGTLAVSVLHADGSTVTTGAISGSGTEPRSVSVAASQIPVTDWLYAQWTIDDVEYATDIIEVAGGTIGNLSQLREADSNLNSVEDSVLLTARRAVEDMSLAILGRSVFERFYVERLNGTGTTGILLAFPDLVEVAWVRGWDGETPTMWDTTDYQGVVSTTAGIAHLPGTYWPWGYRNVEVAYRFGMRAVPGDLLVALRKSIRHVLNAFDTGVPTYAASMQTADGFNFGIASPDNSDWATGDASIDRVVNRYKIEPIGVL